MRLVGILTIGLMVIHATTAAQMVKNRAFDATLRALLSHNVQEIGVAEAALNKHTYTFLDARGKNEYDVSHIHSAIWVGYEAFSADKLSGVSQQAPIIVYCSVGYRSEKITQKLHALGYTNVSNLYGGMFEWVNQGFKVVHNGKETDTVHAYNRAWGIWLTKGKKVYK